MVFKSIFVFAVIEADNDLARNTFSFGEVCICVGCKIINLFFLGFVITCTDNKKCLLQTEDAVTGMYYPLAE